MSELLLLDKEAKFPSTRYQGSKLKLVDWIWDAVKDLNFLTALDAFGGTGSVAYKLKQNNKYVTYNDILNFNWYIGLALIENNDEKLTPEDVDFLLKKHSYLTYNSFIADNFSDIYFTNDENKWLDLVVNNIQNLENLYKKALAYYALFQSCLIKRPFNLFHRKNLYIRISEVKRNFGNKTTWDTPFEKHFLKFVKEANEAVFSNDFSNKAINSDVFNITDNFDLIYIDTPYISNKGIGVDYYNFYHFLEGLVNYRNWYELIDYKKKNKCLKNRHSVWVDKTAIYKAFDNLFLKFCDSTLVLSYRSDGIPSIEDLIIIMKKYKQNITVLKRHNYKYVLSNNHSDEVLLIGN